MELNDRVQLALCHGEIPAGDDPHELGTRAGDTWDEDVDAFLGLDHTDGDAGPTIFLRVPEVTNDYWHAIQIPWSELYAAARRDGFDLSWDFAA